MKKKSFIIYLLFSLTVFCNNQNSEKKNTGAVKGVLDVSSWDFENNGILNLDGDWEFYWSEFIDPGHSTGQINKKAEKKLPETKFLKIPSNWQNNGYPVFGYATYRLILILPEGVKTGRIPLSLSMTDAGSNYEMFINGKTASRNGKTGKIKSDTIPYMKYKSFSLEPFLNEESSRMEILLYVSNFHYPKAGLWNSLKIGYSPEMEKNSREKFTSDLILFSSLLIMGLYHFGLYLNRRKDPSPVYFGIFCVLVSLRTVSISERLILDALPFIPFVFIHKLEFISFYYGSIVFMQFIKTLYPDEFSGKWFFGLLVILLPSALIVVFLPMYYYGMTLVVVQLTVLVAIVYIIKVLITAIIHKRMGAKLFLSGWIIFSFSISHDIFKVMWGLQTPNIVSYGLLIFVIFQASVLSRKFAAAFTESEKLAGELKLFSEELEQKVIERTKELQSTLEKVQELKNQQDGDYFLTSLLLRPLNMNKADSKSVEVEFFSSQKKKFQFKEWKEEIGGDVCMANSIELKGKKFTVFVNADAMGKSLQGAGGALVLGSVFESIINRNRIVGATRNVFPERWIKDAFLELHHVFETFDGSMLVSLVLGLIDDDSGYLYMINAEHPWTILYRDEKASFINTENTYRKLGTLGADGSIYIFTAQLFPGDVLISGSDGRDDVMIPDETGEESINEDESLILSHVEKTGTDLEKIFSEIKSVGKLIDDLTLLKITYKKNILESADSESGDEEEICEQARILFRSGKAPEGFRFLESAIENGRKSPLIYKLLFQEYLKINNYEKAAKISVTTAEMNPGDTEIIFQASYILKKTGDYEAACDLGERVKLRNPSHVRNLINLADSHFFSGNKERAKMLIDLVIELENDNQYAIKRKSVFDKKPNQKI